jgi:hypothetical protein
MTNCSVRTAITLPRSGPSAVRVCPSDGPIEDITASVQGRLDRQGRPPDRRSRLVRRRDHPLTDRPVGRHRVMFGLTGVEPGRAAVLVDGVSNLLPQDVDIVALLPR